MRTKIKPQIIVSYTADLRSLKKKISSLITTKNLPNNSRINYSKSINIFKYWDLKYLLVYEHINEKYLTNMVVDKVRKIEYANLTTSCRTGWPSWPTRPAPVNCTICNRNWWSKAFFAIFWWRIIAFTCSAKALRRFIRIIYNLITWFPVWPSAPT